VLGLPHTGTDVPDDCLVRLNDTGRALADTDWHIDDALRRSDARRDQRAATFHRYVIDANRDPSGESLYPGQNTTGLCPLTDFDGQPHLS
jgi:N-formylglutamate deformylase